MNKPNDKGHKARKDILAFLKSSQMTFAPVTIREIMDATGISSTSVVDYHLRMLEQAEKIHRHARKSRFIQVVKQPRKTAKDEDLPQPTGAD